MTNTGASGVHRGDEGALGYTVVMKGTVGHTGGSGVHRRGKGAVGYIGLREGTARNIGGRGLHLIHSQCPHSQHPHSQCLHLHVGTGISGGYMQQGGTMAGRHWGIHGALGYTGGAWGQ